MDTRLRLPHLVLLLPVTVAAAVSAQSPASCVPVPPIKTSLGTMPGIADLPARPEMPDVMTFENGKKVTTAAQWTQRREEMKRILEYYATGLMPPPPGNVQGQDLKSASVLGGTVRYRLVHLSFGPGSKYGFDVALFVPTRAKGRVPTIVFPTFGSTPGGTPLPTMVRPPEQGKGLDALTIPLGDQTASAAAAAKAWQTRCGSTRTGSHRISASSRRTWTSCRSISTGSSRSPARARSSRSKGPTTRTACGTP